MTDAAKPPRRRSTRESVRTALVFLCSLVMTGCALYILVKIPSGQTREFARWTALAGLSAALLMQQLVVMSRAGRALGRRRPRDANG